MSKDFFVKRLFYILLSGILLSACNSSSTQPLPKPTVSAVKLHLSNAPITKTYIGITQSIASVDIRARVKGFLTEMNFVEGKPVKKDQLLFVIDPRPFEAQLDLAKGNLTKSIAAREFQKVQYQRMKQLVAKGDVAVARYDEVAAQYQEAEGQVQVNTAQVEEAKINLSYCYMRSPFDGIIGNKYVDVGNLVGGTENTLLANIVQLNPIYIEFSPSVEDFSLFLQYRDNMPFKVEAVLPYNNNLIFRGQVDLINNQANTPTSTVLMRAIVENPKQLLLPGIYVSLKMILSDKRAILLVPMSAVVETQGIYSVYTVNQQNKVESRVIQVAGQYNQAYQVSSGLKEGDIVVTSGLQQLKPGEEVTVSLPL